MKGNDPVTRTLNPRAVPIGALPLLLGIPTAGFAQAPLLRWLTGPAAAALSGGEAEGLQTSELGFSRGQSPLLQPLSPQVQERKSRMEAFRLELLLPVLGHGYAGNAQRGVLPAVVHVGGLVALFALAPDPLPTIGPDLDAAYNDPRIINDPRCERTRIVRPGYRHISVSCNQETSAAAWVAVGAVLGGKIWGLVSAVRTVNEHNRSVASGSTATLGLLPTPDGRLGVGMALRF